MRGRRVALLLGLAARMVAILVAGLAALITVNAAQMRLLPSAPSFDVAFDRLELALLAALVASLASAAGLAFWQAPRFTLAERLALSALALALDAATLTGVSGWG